MKNFEEVFENLYEDKKKEIDKDFLSENLVALTNLMRDFGKFLTNKTGTQHVLLKDKIIKESTINSEYQISVLPKFSNTGGRAFTLRIIFIGEVASAIKMNVDSRQVEEWLIPTQDMSSFVLGLRAWIEKEIRGMATSSVSVEQITTDTIPGE